LGYVTKFIGGVNHWTCLILGAKRINLVTGKVITPLSMYAEHKYCYKCTSL